jgi:Icc-related predicted phosphoesterase
VGENVIKEAVGEDVAEERLLREVARFGGRAKIEVLMYEGNLDAKEMLDWIRSMDRHFDYEDVVEERKVK